MVPIDRSLWLIMRCVAQILAKADMRIAALYDSEVRSTTGLKDLMLYIQVLMSHSVDGPHCS